MKYLDTSTVQERRETALPAPRTRSGYGSKLPTSHQLRIGGRWHRVYMVCWSNAGTAYVVKGVEPLYIATGALSRTKRASGMTLRFCSSCAYA